MRIAAGAVTAWQYAIWASRSCEQHPRRATDQLVERFLDSGRRPPTVECFRQPVEPEQRLQPAAEAGAVRHDDCESSRGSRADRLGERHVATQRRVARQGLIARRPVGEPGAELVDQEWIGIGALDEVAHGMGGADQAVRGAGGRAREQARPPGRQHRLPGPAARAGVGSTSSSHPGGRSGRG